MGINSSLTSSTKSGRRITLTEHQLGLLCKIIANHFKGVYQTKEDANKIYYSNPNLLDNGGFDIWQKGTVHDVAGMVYTADRWSNRWQKCRYERIDNPFPDCPCRYAMKITALEDDQWNTAAERLDPDLVKILDGKTITVSAWVMGQSAAPFAIFVGNIDNGYDVQLSDQPQHVSVSGIFHADDDEDKNIVGAAISANIGTQTGDWFAITGVKLELGDTVTPYTPPDPSLELLKCQKYLRVITNTTKSVYSGIGWGTAYSSTNLVINIPISIPMRITPNIMMTGNYVIRGAGKVFTFDSSSHQCVIANYSNASLSIDIGGFSGLIPDHVYELYTDSSDIAKIVLDANL